MVLRATCSPDYKSSLRHINGSFTEPDEGIHGMRKRVTDDQQR